MRGTDDLLPEQRPRSRKRTRRAQPYRKHRGRQAGPTLSAMLKGSPQGLPNPMDQMRAVQRMMRSRRHGR
jgi:hypothetical protein